jgi:putative FmdB family regulatory protein
MPVYVYRNLTTGETFEFEQRMTDAALTVHPTSGDPVKRLIQPVGIAFKGSGFYVTDSRSKGSSTGSTNGAAKERASTGGTASPASSSEGASSTTTPSGGASESAPSTAASTTP